MSAPWLGKPFLVGVAGASGSGKSSLAAALERSLGTARAAVLPLDSYYRDRSQLDPAARAAVNFDEPGAWEVERLVRDLRALRRGCAIEVPIYDFNTHCRRPERRLFRPRHIIIIEGLFALALPEVRELLDLRVGLELPPEQCLQRRLARDLQQRGRTEDSIREQFARQVLPSIELWITPSLVHAELRLSGAAPTAELVESVRAKLPEVADPAGNLPEEFAGLARRLGPDFLAKRLEQQSSLWAGKQHQGEGLLVIERFIPIDRLITIGLKLSGLYGWGHRQAMAVRVVRHEIFSPRIPPALDGFRLLQLSDLHLDIDPALGPAVTQALQGLEYDLAVITGDYRNSTSADFSPAIAAMAQLLPAIKPPVYGILGNHDFIEMAPALEALGLPMLLNESLLHQHGSGELLLGGIDDPHFYATDDLPRVRASCGDDPAALRILLSHSPETYHRADGFDLLLAGHTHAGQICLPGGIAILRIGRCPGAMLAGAWQHGSLLGYTSPGTGCCGVPVRFFCPPEITLHQFHHHPTAEQKRTVIRP